LAFFVHADNPKNFQQPCMSVKLGEADWYRQQSTHQIVSVTPPAVVTAI
jgi:hypothetical protein